MSNTSVVVISNSIEEFENCDNYIFHYIYNINELYNLSLQNIDFSLLLIDIELLYGEQLISPFDILHSLHTQLKLKHTSTTIPIAILVHNDTSKNIIDELTKTDISGFYLIDSENSIEIKENMLDSLINGNFFIPSKLKIQSAAPVKKSKKGIILTPRQRQITSMVVTRGASNKSIANTLKISESTVKLHMSAILKKYGVKNRTQLALFHKNQS